MGIELRCTAGPAAGERITIDAELVLGRDQSEPGRLQGDPRLSRRHARLFINDGGQAAIEDLGSTNGTSVNGERITKARILTTGDEVHAGQTTLRVEVTAQAAETQLDTVRTVASPTVGRAPSRGPALLVVAGPSKGEAIPLGTELLIGRGFGEPGALGGDRQLSRRHARIARGPGGVFYVEDTGSTNGTMLNGVGLRRAHALKDGDEIQLGASRLDARGLPRAPLTVELEEAPAAAPGFDPWQRARPADAPPAGTSAAVPGSGYAAATPGFEFAPGSQFMPQGAAGARLSSRRVIGVFAGVFAAAAIVAAVLVLISAPLGSRACAQGFICHKPPTARPLQALTTFSGALGWRVEYDP